jgi:hypothetical protein
VLVGVLLESRVFVHRLDEMPTVDLAELRMVDLGDAQCDEQFDHELVSGWGGEIGRGSEPGGELVATGIGEVEDVLRAVCVVIGVDEAVALEALQRGVDLPRVERPHLARSRFEVVGELEAVFGTL